MSEMVGCLTFEVLLSLKIQKKGDHLGFRESFLSRTQCHLLIVDELLTYLKGIDSRDKIH